MSDNSLVTIVVPLHNAERYLKKCLQSICSQTYTDLEILVVDDDSTDHSREIARRMAYADSRVRLLRTPGRQGAQHARYMGIDSANGDRLLFVDADDILRPQAVEQLVDAMDRHEADMVQMRFMRRIRCLNIRYGETFIPDLCDRRIDGEEYDHIASYIGMDSVINPSVCAKIYRTRLLRMATRTPFRQFWGDDQIFNIDYLRLARSMAFIPYTGYLYRWGGRTSRFRFSALEDYKNVYRLKLRLGQRRDALEAELLSLLRYYIRQLNTELGWTRDAVVMYLEKELADPLWRPVSSRYNTSALVDCEFARLQKHYFKYVGKRLLR